MALRNMRAKAPQDRRAFADQKKSPPKPGDLADVPRKPAAPDRKARPLMDDFFDYDKWLREEKESARAERVAKIKLFWYERLRRSH